MAARRRSGTVGDLRTQPGRHPYLAHAAASRRLTAAFPLCGVLPQQDEAISLTLFRPLAARREKLMAAINALTRRVPRLPLPVPAYLSLAPDQCRSAPYPGQPAQKPFELSSGLRPALFNAAFPRACAARFTCSTPGTTPCSLRRWPCPPSTCCTLPYKRLIWLPHGRASGRHEPIALPLYGPDGLRGLHGPGPALRLEATDAP